ncbi:MAG: hypothetical protein ACHREM_02460 [Polyangiales bacterium]
MITKKPVRLAYQARPQTAEAVAYEAAGAVGGAATGTVVGMMGGPAGMIAGAIAGGVIGAVATAIVERDHDATDAADEASLEEEALSRPSRSTPPVVGAFSKASMDASTQDDAPPAEGPIPPPET